MHDKDYIELSFPSLSTNESFARQTVAAFAARLDPTLDEIGDIKTSVSEAVTNCAVHAYPDSIGRVFIRARIIRTDTLEVLVRDWGVGIADVEKAMEPMFTTGGQDRSGMGFTIMESFMDDLRVRTAVGKGTSVILRRRIISKAVRQ